MSELLSLRTESIQKTYRDGFEAYRVYNAVNHHINTKDFDAIKYGYKARLGKRITRESFPEPYIFDKIAKRYKPAEWVLLFARNLIDSVWVRDFVGDVGNDKFIRSLGFIENSTQNFESLFNTYLILLHNKRIKFIDSISGDNPLIMQEYINHRIPAEFLILLDSTIPFLHKIESMLYVDLASKLRKYKLLFDIDVVKLNETIKSICS